MNKKKNTKALKRAPRNRVKKTGKQISVSSMHSEMALQQYAKLVLNPCHGPLVRSVSPSSVGSIIERVRTTVTLTPTDTAGYVVWFPSYHNPGTTQTTSGNLFYFTTSTPATAPTNSGAAPFGLGTSAGTVLPDPASANLSATSAFSRAQTLAACLQLEYIGALSAISGQICTIANMSLDAFNTNAGATSGAFTPMSVDNMFEYAASRERLQFSGHEVIWRPSDSSSIMRGRGNQHSGAVDALRADALMTLGTTGSTASDPCSTDPSNVFGIAIAWRGTTGTASTLTFNCVKVADFEIAARNNAIEATYSPSPSMPMGSPVATIGSFLDKYVPGWQRRAINVSVDALGKLATSYAPALLPGFAKGGIRGRLPVPMQPPALLDRPWDDHYP